MTIDYNTFKRFCPSSATPSDELFDMFQTAIRHSLEYVRGLAGEDIASRLDEVEDIPVLVSARDVVSGLAAAAAAYVCNRAYADTVPHLDLILTSTGFGVVSNENVAPASAERVQRLLKALEVSACRAHDALLHALLMFPEWRDSDQARGLLSSLFWNNAHFFMLGLSEPTASQIAQLRPKIVFAEAELASFISPEMSACLLKSMRHPDENTTLMYSVMSSCRRYVAAHVAGDSAGMGRLRHAVLELLTAHAEELPAFRDSSVYAAIKSSRYENKEDDPCYFFV